MTVYQIGTPTPTPVSSSSNTAFGTAFDAALGAGNSTGFIQVSSAKPVLIQAPCPLKTYIPKFPLLSAPTNVLPSGENLKLAAFPDKSAASLRGIFFGVSPVLSPFCSLSSRGSSHICPTRSRRATMLPWMGTAAAWSAALWTNCVKGWKKLFPNFGKGITAGARNGNSPSCSSFRRSEPCDVVHRMYGRPAGDGKMTVDVTPSTPASCDCVSWS